MPFHFYKPNKYKPNKKNKYKDTYFYLFFIFLYLPCMLIAHLSHTYRTLITLIVQEAHSGAASGFLAWAQP